MDLSKNSIADPDSYQLDYCRTENQRWAIELTNNEQEISHLLTLLDDVLQHYAHQSLRHRAIDYHQHLHRLKVRINRLRSDLICESAACDPESQHICRELRFSRHIPLPLQFIELSDELARTQAGCYQFLSVLVQLNLI